MSRSARGALVAAALALASPAGAEIHTRAAYAVKLYGATIAEIGVDGSTTATRYSVTGELTTRGIVGALLDVLYIGKATGRRSGATWLPDRYTETVIEEGERRAGALIFRNRVPVPQGYKEEERGPDALPIADQRDTVDYLTGIFMVLRATQPTLTPEPPEERSWTVRAAAVTFTDIQPQLQVFGEVVAGRKVELRALVASSGAALGLSPRTVKRRWQYALAWLQRDIERQVGEDAP